MNKSNTKLFDYYVYDKELSDISLTEKQIINTINGHSYNVAKNDDLFKKALLESDILLPDGASIVFGVWIINGKKIEKIAGYDIFIYLLNLLNGQNGKCFFLGSMPSTLDEIKNRIEKEFPNIKIESYSPPYKSTFSDQDNTIMLQKVNNYRPDVLFVGMTAPKQEKWVNENRDKIDASTVCSIGAVFDFYAGTTFRPPNWMIKSHLEWLGRLLNEPKRMWRRYLLSTPVFFIDVIKSKLGIFK